MDWGVPLNVNRSQLPCLLRPRLPRGPAYAMLSQQTAHGRLDSGVVPMFTEEGVRSAVKADPLPGMMSHWEFEPYIRYIRFPHFRNLAEGTRVEFSYPVTALVGPNGTNKTAILRALQGCPGSQNMGEYWFSTNLDPIGPDDRHRCIYGYYAPSAGQVVEVIKMRTKRAGDADYWETQRPRQDDGMAPMPELAPDEPMPEDRIRTRWKGIRKDVVYVDFRSRLSAFDTYFHHVPFGRQVLTLADKKKTIRSRSAYLARALDGVRSHVWPRKERIIEPARQLDTAQVAAVSKILGRAYDQITVLTHQYFGFDGVSVRLRASGLNYSEAFAGSGEFAVAMLVTAVTEAQPRSLILLDEPEISLHPGAQQNLMGFIREQAKVRRHQFVLSTHSPEIIRDLPDDAIKVFQARPGDGKIELLSQASVPADAFFRLGVPVSGERMIFVEDALAGKVVERALQLLNNEAVSKRARVEVFPGGAAEIQARMIPVLALSGVECLVMLDGDQRKDFPHSVDDIPDAALRDTAAAMLGRAPKLSLNGGVDGHSEVEERAQLRKVIGWVMAHVAYLPGDDPESLILDLLGEPLLAPNAKAAKKEWEARTRAALGTREWESVTAREILEEERRALAQVSESSADLVQLSDQLGEFLR